jgi:uncharacterized secreted protein with C-terminal beta-propeller domain
MNLPNVVGPIEIHKPNKSLYIVRFLADRLYLVSFAQTNPFYVLDLNKSAVPYAVGELGIPAKLSSSAARKSRQLRAYPLSFWFPKQR